MSTRSTVIIRDTESLHLHLYYEMHDECYHLTMSGASNSAVDVIIPEWMVPEFKKILEPSHS
jgi:hypothetical protein